MKIVFFGSPDFANPSLTSLVNSHHEVVSVVTNIDKPFGRGRKLLPTEVKVKAREFKIPVIEVSRLKNESLNHKLKELNADLFVVVAFRILPSIIFNIPKLGTINLHGSLLPKYQGAAPIHHAILNGETETGLTTFKINKIVDTGEILLQSKIDIKPNDTTGDLWEVMAEKGADLVLKTVNGLENGTLLSKPQDLTKSSQAPKLKKEDFLIDWNKTAVEIHNQIRAFSPRPGAYTILNNKRLKCYNTEVLDYFEIPLVPFQYFKSKDAIYAGTKHGVLKINEVQLEGKKRSKVTQYSTEQNREIINEFQKK
jgi:methionyl-tRNA formyltransferase